MFAPFCKKRRGPRPPPRRRPSRRVACHRAGGVPSGGPCSQARWPNPRGRQSRARGKSQNAQHARRRHNTSQRGTKKRPQRAPGDGPTVSGRARSLFAPFPNMQTTHTARHTRQTPSDKTHLKPRRTPQRVQCPPAVLPSGAPRRKNNKNTYHRHIPKPTMNAHPTPFAMRTIKPQKDAGR